MKAFGKVMPAYSFGNSPFYLTGEILLEPKEGIAIEKILNLIDKKTSIIRHSKYNYYVLESKDWKNILNHSNEIYESGLVKYCHPNFIAPVKRSADDPLYSDQYYLHNTGQFGGTSGIDINAPGAWNITTGLSPVKIAIIDDGIENHEDFDGRVLSGYTAKYSSDNPDTEGAPNAEDPPSTAYPRDVDAFGHGVSCAGIVAAGHNSKGIRGVAPNVQIVPVNIFNDWEMVDAPYPYDSMVVHNETPEDYGNAISYAWNSGAADVLSNSWAFNTSDSTFPGADHIIGAINDARMQGRNGRGSIVVFSSGNTGDVPVRFPANVDGVITTGAIDKNGNIQSYSCRGSSMDLVAPSGGGNVWTTDRMGDDGLTTGNYRDDFGGTSAACPQVSGTAALMLSANPQLSESQVRHILQETATDMGASGFDNTFGYGRLNASAALLEATGGNISGSGPVCYSPNTTFSMSGETTGLSFSWTKSSNLTAVSGSSSCTYTVKAASSSTSGEGWVKVTIKNSCNKTIANRQKDIWVGRPRFSITGTGELYPKAPGFAALCEYGTSDPIIVGGENDPGIANVQWSYSGPLEYISGETGINYRAKYAAGLTSGQGLIYANATNACGSVENNMYYSIESWLSLFPNPTEGTLYVELNETSFDKLSHNSHCTLSIFDKQMHLRKTKRFTGYSTSIDLYHLSPGVYIVRVKAGEKTTETKIMVK